MDLPWQNDASSFLIHCLGLPQFSYSHSSHTFIFKLPTYFNVYVYSIATPKNVAIRKKLSIWIIWKTLQSVYLLILSLSLKFFHWPTEWVCAKLLQLCPTLFDPMNRSPPVSSVHGILQARILEWAVMPSSRGSSNPGIRPGSFMSPALGRRFFSASTSWEAPRLAEYKGSNIFCQRTTRYMC